MRIPRLGAAAAAALAVLSLCSSRCSVLDLPRGEISVLSWNLQTLFDDRDDGVEFPGWSVANGQWDSEGYRTRLRNFSRAASAAVPGGPDILVLQEVENQRVAEDLAALLPGSWPTLIVSGGEGAAFGCAVLSRFPAVVARAHAVDPGPGFRPEDLRPLLEVVLDAEGIRLTILAAHWKSKVGGAEATEPARRAQAALAARRIAEILAEDPAAELLLAGDLNENPDEWERVGRAWPTALLPADRAARADGWKDRILLAADPGNTGPGPDGLVLWSPWEEAGGFSYVHEGTEERIDHVLLCPGLLDGKGLAFSSFSAVTERELLSEDGTPRAWDTRNREGYSDHLPLRLALAWR
ncbi:MAG TPA: endonuclease/exonuclease/phosphatase family protein [Spirochaetia bacterium]|nr:endonuclease/exonuclease/phosphatase family protein [Spirochaetales bacterium]HRY80395.1 endonuclease/exonuclease/phosphatase family protein [Spirochaetia bacterium]